MTRALKDGSGRRIAEAWHREREAGLAASLIARACAAEMEDLSRGQREGAAVLAELAERARRGTGQ